MQPRRHRLRKLARLDSARAWQIRQPGREEFGVVVGIVERWACFGGHREQVLVEAEELGQLVLRRGERAQARRHRS